MATVFEIAHLPWLLIGKSSGDFCAGVSRTVVDEPQIPIIIRLRKYALNRFLNELFRIQKNRDDRDLMDYSSPSILFHVEPEVYYEVVSTERPR